MRKQLKNKKPYCDHDYKNAIQVGPVDYFCQKCKELIDPLEWFLGANFETIDCTPKVGDKKVRRQRK